MTLQRFNAAALFILLIITISAHGMEQNNNNTHALICFPPELQHQIVFPCGITITQVTEDNADELKECIKTFFRFKRVCKQFNKNFKGPWADLALATKNKMMQEVNALMTKRTHKECLTARYACDFRFFHEHPEKVSLGYKKYRVISLALVCSGADADITDKMTSTTCLSKAVYAQDTVAVALLLNHKADPYQEAFEEDQLAATILGRNIAFSKIWYGNNGILGCSPIYFLATTGPILELFLEKIDKQIVLESESGWHIGKCRYDHYSLEVTKTWLEYGFSVDYNPCFLHLCLNDYYQSPFNFRGDIFFKKIELLLKVIPHMINNKDKDGSTPLDIAYKKHGNYSIKINAHEKIIALFRKYGGKTAQELEEENTQLIKQHETSDDIAKI
jgi:hypothetical protein